MKGILATLGGLVSRLHGPSCLGRLGAAASASSATEGRLSGSVNSSRGTIPAGAAQQGHEADKARAGKGTAALAAYARCSTDLMREGRVCARLRA